MRTTILAALLTSTCLGGSITLPVIQSAAPTLTPQFFAAATTTDPNVLTAQPQEPTTLYGSGFKGKCVLQLDIPDRWRIKAGGTLRVTAGTGNLDPGKGWFSNVTFYAVGDHDSAGSAVSGSTSTVSNVMTRNSRTVATGTFSSIGYAIDLVNPSYPTDRYIYLYAVGTPVNGYARRTYPICILLEGTSRVATDTYVDPVNGVDQAVVGAGTAANPYKTLTYGLAKCSLAGSVFVDCQQSASVSRLRKHGFQDLWVGSQRGPSLGWTLLSHSNQPERSRSS